MEFDRNHPALTTSADLTREEDQLGFGSTLFTTPLKFGYDFLKFGADVGDWVMGNEEATLDSYWEVEESITGKKRSNASKMTSEILTLIGGTKAVAKSAEFGIKAWKGAEGLSKFKAFKDANAINKIGTVAVESAIADFVWSSPDAPRLSDIIKQHAPSVHNSITEYLATDGDDTVMESRMKNAIEGGILGVGADILGRFLFGTARHIKGKGSKLPVKDQDAFYKSTGFDTEQSLKGLDLDDLVVHKADDIDTVAILAKEAGLIDDLVKATPEELADAVPERLLREMNIEEITPKLAQDFVDTGAKLPKVLNQRTLGDLAPDQVDRVSRTLGSKFSKEVHALTSRGKSFQQMQKEADEFIKSLNVEDQLKRELIEASTDEEVAKGYVRVAVFKPYVQAKQRALGKTAEELLKKGFNEASDEELLKFLAQADEASDALARFLKIRTGNSHALMAHKIKPNKGIEKRISQLSKKELQQESVKQQIKEVAGEFSGSGKPLSQDPRIQKLVRDVADHRGDLNMVSKSMETAGRPLTTLDVIKEIRMTSMLSGLGTHVVNFAGNSMMLGLKSLERLVSATLSVPSRILGDAGEDIITFKEAFAFMNGVMSNTPDVVRMVASDSDKLKEALIKGPVITGKNFNKAFPNMPLGTTMARVVDVYGKMSRKVSFGVLGKADNFFQNRGMTMELMGLTERYGRRIATETGKSVDEVAQRLQGDVLSFIQGDVARISGKHGDRYLGIIESIADQVKRTGKEVTFQREMSGGLKRVNAWLNQDNTIPKMVSTFIVPFFKTPANIVREVAEMTPFVSKYMTNAKHALNGSQGEVARKLAQSKIIVGTALYSTAGAMVMSGQVTGRHDPRERALKQQAGIPEYSVKIGDSWYQYNRLDPVGMFFGLTADIIQISQQEGKGSFSSLGPAMLLSVSSNLISKTYLKGVSDFLKALEDPDRMANFMKNAVRPVLNPLEGAQKTALHFLDDASQRDIPKDIKSISDFVDTMWANNILHRSNLQVSVDMLGNQRERELTGLADWTNLLGIRRTKPSDSNAMREISRLRARMPDRAPPKIQGVEMTMEEHNEFLRSLKDDLNLESVLEEFVTSKEYLQLHDEQRAKVLKSMILKFRKGAQGLFLSRNPNFVNDIIRHKEEQVQALLNQNNFINVGTKADVVNDDLLKLNINVDRFERSE